MGGEHALSIHDRFTASVPFIPRLFRSKQTDRPQGAGVPPHPVCFVGGQPVPFFSRQRRIRPLA